MTAPNILVVVVDGLRASALGAYGNTSFPTPALDRFAAESFLLDWCYAPAADLAEIYGAILHSSTHPPNRLPSISLPRQIAAAGFTATLVTDETELAALEVTDQFDQCLQLAEPLQLRELPARAEGPSQTKLARLFASAAEVVASAETTSSRLVWVHSRGMYGPWDAPLELQLSLLDEGDPPPVEEVVPPDFTIADPGDPDAVFRYACAYAAQTMVFDACWEGLLNAVASSGERWLVMLLGARGFPLGEHRRVGGIDPRLYGDQLHVPWIIRFADGLGGLARSSALATHCDLLPTLVEICCAAEQDAMRADGSSILPLARSSPSAWRTQLIATSHGGQRAIRTPDWCLRQDPANSVVESTTHLSRHSELYVRPDDRWESNDVAKLCPDVIESLTQMMDSSPKHCDS